MLKIPFVNLKGDLFATTSSFAGQTVIKLCSSLILTRLVAPETYGIIAILTSIIFVVEMLADLGVTVSLIRHPHGDEPRYLNTAWTIRFYRSVLNFVVVFVGAPVIARIYALPSLATPMRVISVWFLLIGLESMSFPLAIRRKNARIVVYSEFQATAATAIFTVVFSYFYRNFWGMALGALLNRLLLTLFSRHYYRESRPKFQIDRAAARELLSYTRFSMPSSILTLALSQFDKVAFLRLFDLNLFGIYSLAGNLAGPVESLISKISQVVLYPRCAHDFRTDPATFPLRYYTSNVRLFAAILILPAVVGGAAQEIVSVLYDPRYARAGFVLQAFMVRAAMLSLASPAEDMLIAAGTFHMILIGNIYRAIWVVCGSLLGYYFFGFPGFVYGISLSGLVPLIYYLILQYRKGYLVPRYELYRVGFIVGVALLAYVASTAFMMVLPGFRIHR